MKQTSLFFFLLLITCGGAESESIVVQDSSNDTVLESTTTTVDDTKTTTTQETTTTIQDSTTTLIPKNKCDDCEYVTITELISNINNVPKYAWNDYQRISKENNIFENDSFEIIINIGPSTDLYFQDNEKYIQKGISFWQNFNLPEKYYGFFYNYGDLDWATSELTTTGFEGGMARAPCRDGICSGANSGIYQRPPHFGVGVFGIHSGDSVDNYRYGPLHIHEVTHSVVASQWIGNARNPQQSANDATPCWLNEGIAHAAGISLGVETYEEYLDMRSSQVRARHIQVPFNDYSASIVLDYYNKSIPGDCIKNPDYVLGYSIGYLTVEAMNAMSGADSAMHMYSVMGSGKDFEEAFEMVYELSWNDAKPIFAEYVSMVITNLFNS
ncbi:hypothetical protein N9U28_00425 [Acidimicrobiaceae bacterium]|nr:hypothetical protein [Acidimicrobiaceae bacterium]